MLWPKNLLTVYQEATMQATQGAALINAMHNGSAMAVLLQQKVTWNAVGNRRPGLHHLNSFIGSRLDDISPGGLVEQNLVLIISACYVGVLPESCPCMCYAMASESLQQCALHNSFKTISRSCVLRCATWLM